MSKARNNIPRAAIHVGAPAKSFSAVEGYEPERRGWDEKTYRLKNLDTNNHYDDSRKHLNFEINNKGQIVPLGSNPVPLHERLQKRLDELGFKPYKDKDNPLGYSENSPNCTVGIIISGDHDVLTRLAFGDQDVDFTLQRSNANVRLQQDIKDWAMDTYHWACFRWGAENIIGFDVHLDETTPHIHIQTVPVAKTTTRGRASVKYVHNDDKSKVLSHKEWKKLPEEIRNDFIRTEVERREKECVSYARVWGEDKYAVGRTYYQLHTDYYNAVGHKYGLERGDDISMLPGEERRERVHKSKAILEAERQAKDAITSAKAEAQRLEDYVAALDFKEEDLIVPALNTSPLVKNAWNAIKEELGKPIPAFGQKEWREERRQAIKTILTELQDELFTATEAQKEDILKVGRSLYNKAMKDARAIVEKDKQLKRQNERLIQENNNLKSKLSQIDETAIEKLRQQKDGRISQLESELKAANRDTAKAMSDYTQANIRANKATEQLEKMLAVPEIRDMWNTIKRRREVLSRQFDKWIARALDAITTYSKSGQSLFTDEQDNAVRLGILAQTCKDDLDSMDDNQRMQATHNLLEQVDWSDMSERKYNMGDYAPSRPVRR